ncbi:MAG: hydrogen peroxide-inducible genes activator [Bacteroidales bacterium]|nr:hydrogen peroxide-inducible genes activator [Bacteroidales bacterium]
MNLNQIEYFNELVRWQNFSKAAQSLNISQPALSLQIQKLEEELGFKLVNRLKKPMKLTPEGEIFLERAREILHQVDELRNIALEMEDAVSGTLHIGIIPTLSPYFLPLFINDLNRNFPDLQLEVEELITGQIITGLKTGNLDAGIISTPVETNGIEITPMFYERFYLYVSDKHPLFENKEIDTNSLDTEDIWYLKEGNCFQNQVNAICRLAGKPTKGENLVYSSNSIESLRRIVETRKGITFIPELATLGVASEYEDLIKPLSGEQPVREISLVQARKGWKSRLVEAFLQTSMAAIPERMKTKPKQNIVDTELRIS